MSGWLIRRKSPHGSSSEVCIVFTSEHASACLAVFMRVLLAWQKKKARAMGLRAVHAGAVSFVQRFSGSAGLYVHVHALVPEGVFTEHQEGSREMRRGLDFHRLAMPTDEEEAVLAARLAKRTQTLFERPGQGAKRRAWAWGIADREGEDFAVTAAAWIEHARRHAPAGEGPAQERKASLLARVEGFTLQAGTFLHEHDREGLARLVRYALRPPLAESRLSRAEDRRIVLRLKRPRPDGTSEHVLTPIC